MTPAELQRAFEEAGITLVDPVTQQTVVDFEEFLGERTAQCFREAAEAVDHQRGEV